MQDEYRCKGYATEAVKELINWAFSFKNVTEVIAETEKDNLPSHRVLEKIRMQKYQENEKMFWWKLTKVRKISGQISN